jgi:geranylgeranyl pyrophosphate synthase
MLQVDDVIRAAPGVRCGADQPDLALHHQCAGGKRIRPRLVLLLAQALGFEGPSA